MAQAVAALVKLTLLKLDITTVQGDIFVGLSFMATVVGYNFVKYVKVANLYHSRLTRSMKVIQAFTAICLVVLLYLVFQLTWTAILYAIPLLVLTIIYAVPVFPNNKNLRSIAGIKIFIIGLVWTGITVIIPVIYSEKEINFDVCIEILQRFIFVVVLMLPFEIRDLQYDARELGTIPQRVGITRTKVFGSILLFIFLLCTPFKNDLSSLEIIVSIVITIICLLFLWGTEKKQSEYFCSFWVESIPILWLGIWIFLQHLIC
ncbi:hypothetical protein GCM10022393_12540 [Aquimarina addita]|uniref:Prenyltransferase n=1 Tax=Aquimarina addita TaxID=870485 RepID=A0ABP7XF13_9FLAO